MRPVMISARIRQIAAIESPDLLADRSSAFDYDQRDRGWPARQSCRQMVCKLQPNREKDEEYAEPKNLGASMIG
jgi:hypothetical protein